jgi:hypothetical protein
MPPDEPAHICFPIVDVHRQHSWDKLGRLKKGVFLAHRSVPPWSDFCEPITMCARLAAQCLLDRRVHEDAGKMRQGVGAVAVALLKQHEGCRYLLPRVSFPPGVRH